MINVGEDKTIECKGEKPVTWVSEVRNFHFNLLRDLTKLVPQILAVKDGNVNVLTFVNDDGTQNIYKSSLEFQSINTDYVGRYYCVFNKSLKAEPHVNYDAEVEKFKATSIYIFVDGERWIDDSWLVN